MLVMTIVNIPWGLRDEIRGLRRLRGVHRVGLSTGDQGMALRAGPRIRGMLAPLLGRPG
jgi:hypothetical protein